MSFACERIMTSDHLDLGMSETAWDASEEEVQENIDQAVEDAKNFNFATLDELKEAFNQ